jgi:hypothetical protein
MIWDLIDDRWDYTLHPPLDAIKTFLNPALFYYNDFD